MRKLPALGFFFLVLGVGAGACGDSEKKKGASNATGGSATAGSPSAGSGGASGNASGAGGTAGATSAGSAGGGVAGASGATTGGDAGSGEGGEAGEGPEGGAAGEGGTGPDMKAERLDVLFVIDNSISMYEKQTVLAQAVPTLVSRLVDPYCIFSDTTTVPATNGMCPPSSVREIAPVRDMHVGVITSALGHRGGEVCVPIPDEMPPRPVDDQAHLIGTVRTGLTSWNGSGFLKWDPAGQAMPPGESSAAALTSALQAMIAAAGDRGCGFEAPLEAMYRFLVDPDPPLTVTNDGQFTVLTGTDTALLDQRAAFLRPDSALIVIMLSDEDDCSILTEPNQQGWVVGRRLAMPRASSECAHPENPDTYACCRHCLTDVPGCPPNSGDVECMKGTSLTPAEDSTNLRCYRQTQRFGLNLLYPVERYVTGLTAAQIPNRAGMMVPNSLFSGTRTPQHVVLTTIVGVPWQDLVKETENFDGYEIMTARELRDDGRFPIILGDYAAGVPPTDPFMIDSIDPRSGTNPLTGQSIAPATAAPNATINGHEQNIVNRDDLQYACTFLLPQPIPCTTTNADGCDCNASEQAYSRPLCEYPGPGTEGTQTYAKAYPGRRELEVARRLRDQAVLASICPRSLADPMHPSYGYVPAMRALQRQVRRILLP